MEFNSLENLPKPDRDLATESGSMGLFALESLVQDIRYQPEWRQRSDLCANYYDGKQIDAAKRADMELSGQPVTIINLIQRTINGALGQEAKARVDAKVTADGPEFDDVAEVVNTKLHEVVRESYLDVAISDAYKDQLVAGVGWVEVSRDPDPLSFDKRVQHVHRNEIWWDWRARRRDLKDARWLVRQRWGDIDEAKVMFPKHKKLLDYCLTSGPIPDILQLLNSADLQALEAYNDNCRRSFRRVSSDDEWFDADRKRVRMYEVWYKVPMAVEVIEGQDGQKVRFNPKNPIHQQALNRGLARVIRGPSYQLRMAMFAGPYRLMDVATERRLYPYIPFWCYRDDQHRTPYGLTDGMLSPQDEYNDRRSKLHWLLKAKQVFVDNDALDDKYNSFIDLALEAMRPDAMFVMNANRKNAQGLQIKNDISLKTEQVEVMQDAKQLIQEVPGIYSTMLGDAPTGVTSGLAINSLVEQGMVALGEVNDNYRHGRRMVNEALVELIVEDMRQPNLAVRTGKGKKVRVVVLNTFDQETGEPINQVGAATLKTGLADVPSTPAFKMQEQQQIATVLQAVGANPDAVAALTPAFIEASTIPHKEEIAAWMRQRAGIPEPGEADKQDQAQQMQMAQQQQAAQAQQVAMQAQMQEMAAKIEEAHARAAKAESDVALNHAKTAEIIQRLHHPELNPALQPPQPTQPDPAQAQEQAKNQAINDSLAEALA